MRRFILLFFFVTICVFAFGQRKKDILAEVNQWKRNVVSTASFDTTESEVWNAIYIIATEKYADIVRESESKGYIEAKKEKEFYKEFFTVEIRGNRPYRVSFLVKQQKRTKKEDGSYTSWVNYTSNTLWKYYSRLQFRLWYLLKGPLVLPNELQKKIDDFNNIQTKERKKIVKGKDY